MDEKPSPNYYYWIDMLLFWYKYQACQFHVPLMRIMLEENEIGGKKLSLQGQSCLYYPLTGESLWPAGKDFPGSLPRAVTSWIIIFS